MSRVTKISIGNNLKNARRGLRMSSEDASAKLGVSRHTLAAWENDKGRFPNADVLLRMAELYKCDINLLLGQTTAPTPGNAKTTEKGISVVGQVTDKSTFEYDFEKEPRERLPISSPAGAELFALKVVSDGFQPIAYPGEYVVFEKSVKTGENLEISIGGAGPHNSLDLRRGVSVGRIVAVLRKPRVE